jgi:hypothetical protein
VGQALAFAHPSFTISTSIFRMYLDVSALGLHEGQVKRAPMGERILTKSCGVGGSLSKGDQLTPLSNPLSLIHQKSGNRYDMRLPGMVIGTARAQNSRTSFYRKENLTLRNREISELHEYNYLPKAGRLSSSGLGTPRLQQHLLKLSSMSFSPLHLRE